jgi:hypothetical protein
MHDVVLTVLSHGVDLLTAADPKLEPDSDWIPSAVTDKLNQLLGGVRVVVTVCCVAGVFIVAAKMAINHRRGEGGEHAMGLALVGVACVLAATAVNIVGALVG